MDKFLPPHIVDSQTYHYFVTTDALQIPNEFEKVKWCEERNITVYRYYNRQFENIFCFKTKDDAFLFELIWC